MFHHTFAHCAILNVLWHLGWEAEACAEPAYVGGLLDSLADSWLRLNREVVDG